MPLTISVAMCTYNGAQFVEEQLQSIFRQTVAPMEVVVADDGSDDGTLDRVASACSQVGVNVKVLGVTNRLGVTLNFQRAIEACSGDLIALSDQDDIWHPDRLAKALSAFETDQELLLHHSNARLVDDQGKPLHLSLLGALRITRTDRDLITEGRAFEAYLRRNLVTGATVVFRRTLCERAIPFPVQWMHDEWLAILASAAGRVQLCDDELIDYRQHSRNQVGVKEPTLRYQLGRMLQPRGTRYSDLAARAEILVDRLVELQSDTNWLDLATQKLQFETARASFPERRIARIGSVLKSLSNGSYRQLSSQRNLDAVRDLLQAA